MTRRVVVLGTGTGVGKTWVTTALARALSERCPVASLKPVESGVDLRDAGAVARSDGALLSAASSVPVAPAPYCFDSPISPHLAARREGITVVLERILTYVQEHESSVAAGVMVIEGAGGLFTPLGAGITNFDLARALEPALWVLVASDSLGVLHDLTATLGLAKSYGRSPDFVVLSRARESDASTGTNAAELESLGLCEGVITLPRGESAPLAPIVEAVLGR